MANKEEKLGNPWQETKDKYVKHGTTIDCPVWGEQPHLSCFLNKPTNQDLYHYWSPRAGGAFALSGSINDNIHNYVKSENEKISFSRWVYEKNSQGIVPEIMSTDFPEITNLPKLSIDEQVQRLLLSYAELPTKPSSGIWISGVNILGHFDGIFLAMSNSTCIDNDDFHWLKDAALENGTLELKQFGISRAIIRLTPKGLQEIQKIHKTTQSEQAFVAMWFDDSMKDVYNKAIKPAIEAAGYSSYRVDDDRSHSDQITNKILAEIKNSKFLIADFTHGDSGARGGVYFEAGYAQGLGIPVLWLIKDNMKNAHFDTNHYPHTIWKDGELKQLKQNIQDNIIAHQHIGKGPK